MSYGAELFAKPLDGDRSSRANSDQNFVASGAGANSHKEFANQELTNLAQAVLLSRNGISSHATVLCGVDEDGASSEICVALGRTLAKSTGQSVCLVDADVRTARLSRLIHKDHLAPVSTSNRDKPEKVEKELWLASIATLGSLRSDSLATPEKLRIYLDGLKESFPLILIDAPGINTRSDAAVLSQLCDGTILVIEANSTRKASALKAKRILDDVKVRLLGCVLNNRTFPIPEKLYRRL